MVLGIFPITGHSPASAVLGNPIPADEAGDPQDFFVDTDALFVYVTADPFGGEVCIVPAADPLPSSCNNSAWGTPNFISGLGTQYQLIEGPPLVPGHWQLISDSGEGEVRIGGEFVVRSCTAPGETPPPDCATSIGAAAAAAWKAGAADMLRAMDASCVTAELLGLAGKAYSMRGLIKGFRDNPVSTVVEATIEFSPISPLGAVFALGNPVALAISWPSHQLALAIYKEVACNAALMYTQVVADPPDPNYMSIPEPNFGFLPDVPAGEAEADAVLSSLNAHLAFGEAVRIAYERYQGAVEAGDLAWEHRLAQAIADLGFDAVDAGYEAADDARAWAAVLDANLENPSVSAQELADAVELRARIAADGFTAGELQQLEDGGLAEDDISWLRSAFSVDISGASVGTAPGDELRAYADALEAALPAWDGFAREAAAVAGRTNSPPAVSFTAVPDSGTAPLEVMFTDTSTDADGDTLTRAWAFGDGESGAGAAATHVYAEPGTYTATLTVSDGASSVSASRSITASDGSNAAPIAVDDAAATAQDTSVSIDVLGNDSDPDGDSLTITSFDSTSAQGGSVSCGTECEYIPSFGFSGDDSFTYTIGDGRGGADSATVLISVAAASGPIAVDDDATATSGELTFIDVLTNDRHPEDEFFFIVEHDAESTAGGTVFCSFDCEYTSPPGFIGVDTFTYTIADWRDLRSTATVTVTVTERPNWEPVAVTDLFSFITEFDGPTVELFPTWNDFDADGDLLTLTAPSATTAGGALACDEELCDYTWPVGFTGIDSFHYTVDDGFGGSSTAWVYIAVDTDHTFEYPFIGPDSAMTLPGVPVEIDVLANDVHPLGAPLSIRYWERQTSWGGSVECAETCVYTPPPDGFEGFDWFAYLASDGDGGAEWGFVDVLVTDEINAPPQFEEVFDVSVAAGHELFHWASATDADPDDTLTYELVDGPTGLLVESATGQISWMTAALDVGVHAVTVRVTDDGTPALSDEVTFDVTVTANQAPTIEPIDDVSVPENTYFSAFVVASDVDFGGLTLELVEAPPGLTMTDWGFIEWTPTSADVGPHSVRVRVTDDGDPQLSAEEAFQITVLVENQSPTLEAVADVSVNEGESVAFAAQASDPDNDGIVYSLTNEPFGATIDSATGEFSWDTGEVDGPGDYPITVIATDDGVPAMSAQRTFTVRVAEVNEAPTVILLLPAEVKSNLPFSGGRAVGSDPDLPANQVSFELFEGPDGMSIDPVTGEITYIPNDADAGTYTVRVRATDDGTPALFGEATATVVVLANDPPDAVDDAFTVYPGSSRQLSVLGNDTDVNGDELSITSWTQGSRGTVDCVASTQVCTYVDTLGEAGEDTFTYTVEDGRGGSDTASVTVTLGFCAPISGACISNGTVLLGVNELGNLNVPGDVPSLGHVLPVGLRYLPTGAESTAPGCLCEGWGAGDAQTLISGFANAAIGTSGLTPVSFDAEVDRATSVVDIGGVLEATHEYRPSATPELFEVLVTLRNTSDSDVEPRYRRVMDWDVEPTAFSEHVTIGGAGADAVRFASNNGFATANPFGGETDLGSVGNFVDVGPKDHGALFDFGFPRLGPGESVSFLIFYGASATESQAFAALRAVGAEVYSLGQPGTDEGRQAGSPNTFIFAFGDVGGDPVGTPQGATDEYIVAADAILTVNAAAGVLANDFDPDGDALTATLESGPAQGALEFEPDGSFVYVPDAGFAGTDSFRYLPEDAVGPGRSTLVTIYVGQDNSAPSLAALPDREIDEETLFSTTAAGTDPDAGQSLTYSLDGPSGATIHPSTGLLTWTPTEAQGPGIYQFVVSVTDDGSPARKASRLFSVTVTEVNRAPSLSDIADQDVVEGEPVVVVASATDPDVPANTITYSLDAGPSGATIDPETGVFSWPSALAGDHEVTVRVTDDGFPSLTAATSFTVRVAATNTVPVVTAVDDLTMDEETELTLLVQASDPDGDGLTFSLTDGPAGMNVSAAGALTFTPTESQGPGVYPVRVTVTDDGAPALSAETSFAVTVDEVNRAPTLAGLVDETVSAGSTYEATAIGSDPDVPANGLTYHIVEGPSALTLDPATGSVSWPTAAGDIGDHTLTIRVDDDGAPSLSASLTITLTVEPVETALTYVGDVRGQYSDEVELAARLVLAGSDTAVSGQTVHFSLGTLSTTGVTGIDGVARATVALPGPAGEDMVTAEFDSAGLYAGDSASAAFETDREDAEVSYVGDTLVTTGSQLSMVARVADSAADDYAGAGAEGTEGSIGDITHMWVRFSLFDAASCGSGTPLAVLTSQVLDAGESGDGVGQAAAERTMDVEGAYCVAVELVGGPEGDANAYYATANPEPVALAVYTPTRDDFVTGGGWVEDEPTGKRGHFGFVARPKGSGKTSGNLLFAVRTMWDGEPSTLMVKSTSLTDLRFVGRDQEMLALIDGKASVKITSAGSGRVLYDRSGITFRATAGDGRNAGPDRFGIDLWFRDQFEWSAPLDDLAKGSIVIHTRASPPGI